MVIIKIKEWHKNKKIRKEDNRIRSDKVLKLILKNKLMYQI
jgi:hypothetical protein